MSPEDHARDLPRYREWAPAAHDIKGLRFTDAPDDVGDWIVLYMRHRDSSILAESNYDACIKALDAERWATYLTPSFGHWAVGWVQPILVKPDAIGLRVCGEIACALDTYPVLDDDDFSERESEDAWAQWECWGHREFVRDVAAYLDLSDNAADLLEDFDASETFAFVERDESWRPDCDVDFRARDVDRALAAKWLRMARKGGSRE